MPSDVLTNRSTTVSVKARTVTNNPNLGACDPIVCAAVVAELIGFLFAAEVNASSAVVVEVSSLPEPFPPVEPEVTEIEVPLTDIVTG